MSIAYNYEVVAVDQAAKCMEVKYTALGYPTQHIGCRLPYPGESLEDVIDIYSPVRFWQEQAMEAQTVAVGASGTINPNAPLSFEETKALKLIELSAKRFEAETSGVTVDGMTYSTQRDAQLQIANVNAALQAGTISEALWKTADGTFVTLTAVNAPGVVAAVVAHVQECFALEESLRAQAIAAATLTELAAVVWP